MIAGALLLWITSAQKNRRTLEGYRQFKGQ